MKKKRIISCMIVISFLISVCLLPADAINATSLSGETKRTVETIDAGGSAVTLTHIETSAESDYGQQALNVIEYDYTDTNLSMNVVDTQSTVGNSTVTDLIDHFNSTNTDNQVAIAAVNGDIWTDSDYGGSSSTNQRGQVSSDPDYVLTDGTNAQNVKSDLFIPRGYTVVDGEIIYTKNSTKEVMIGNGSSPEQNYVSFGIDENGIPRMACICTDTSFTYGDAGTKVSADGINRLPDDGMISIYTDKGPADDCCLDDCYEIYVDSDTDYKLTPTNTITGTVTGISAAGEERQSMQENRFIITGRGSSKISKLSNIKIGDQITVSCTIKALTNSRLTLADTNLTYDLTLTREDGETEKEFSARSVALWNNMKDCIGGQNYVVSEGNIDDTSSITSGLEDDSIQHPMTLIGITSDKKLVLVTDDGRQTGWSDGVVYSQWDSLCSDLGIVSAMMLDGGGSTEMVALQDGSYNIVNSVSGYDKTDPSTVGKERKVTNAVVISYTSDEPVECVHNWVTEINYPTFTQKGSIIVKCSKCGEIQSSTDIPLLGDVYTDDKINSKDCLAMRRSLVNGGPDANGMYYYDTNSDDLFNAKDLLTLRKWLVKLI